MPMFIDAADDQALLREVVAFYQRKLRESPEAQAWLSSHALASAEVVERFKLGYADRTLGLTLPEKNRKAGAEVRARLQRLGLLRQSGHEHLAGALTIPVIDAQGAVVQVYGRLIGASLRAGTPRDVYLPGPLRGVWNLDGLDSKEVILAGSLLDGLALYGAGERHVTAALTLDEVPAEVLAALTSRKVQTVLVAYPHDQRGDEPARMVALALQAEGIAPVRVELPEGTGPRDLARRRGVAAMLEAIQGARSRTGAVAVPGTELPTPAPPVSSEPALTPAQAAPGPTSSVQEPATTPDDEGAAHEVVIDIEDRRYRVRGLERNTSYAQLKVNILATRRREGTPALHVDTLDLYGASKRAVFVRQAAAELGLGEELVKQDLGRVLLELEAMQADVIRKALQPRAQPAPVLTASEEAAALDLLRDQHLAQRIVNDSERCGVVGEGMNVLVGYLAAVSRKLDRPLAIVIQSSSAAGKSALLDAILAFVPTEDRLQFSALTGQALYYLGANDIRHKVLAIAEDEGAERAAYALKLLQSERELKIASTAKDSTGRLVAEEYLVRGPVALFLTTTSVQVDEELLNRCIVLTVNEGREQTRAIHRAQRERETLEGLAAQEEREAILKVHQDAQRLLRPLQVANPYAPRLTFLDDRTRTRRDHMKYLALIRAVALLHQHQREVKRTRVGGKELEYVEVTVADIVLANRLADEVLGRSLDDLPPHTRQLLGGLHDLVAAASAAQGMERQAYRFTRRTVREQTGWGDTQLKVHLRRLLELEYLVVHRSGRGHAYELAYDGRGKDGGRFLAGLLDPERLADAVRAGGGRPPVGPWSAGGRSVESIGTLSGGAEMEPEVPPELENAQPGPASEPHVVGEDA